MSESGSCASRSIRCNAALIRRSSDQLGAPGLRADSRKRRGNCTGKADRDFLKLRRIAIIPCRLGRDDDRQ